MTVTFPIRKRAVSQWCSEEAADDIGAERIGQWAAKADADDNGLMIVGEVEVQRLDARDSLVSPHDHPPGLPIYIVATYRCLPSSSQQ